MSKIEQLRKIKTSEPRKFWKFLNGNQKNTSNISVAKCFEFFKDINRSKDEENIGQNVPENNADDIEQFNEEINGPILWSEIEKAVRSLKNNKSSGLDEILNGHIKSSYNLPSMRNALLKIFNIVFDSGLVPTQWSIGDIIPIYKQKGNKDDAANYRPIPFCAAWENYLLA